MVAGTVFLLGGVMVLSTGCGNANSAASAARLSDKTAKRCDYVLRKLDTFENSHFNFPAAFGGEFFVDGYEVKAPIIKKTKKSNKSKPSSVASVSGALAMDDIIDARYLPRFFEKENLNMENPTRQFFLDGIDDLYKICADVSAANSYKNQLIADMRYEAATMRGLASDLRNKRVKANWAEFNRANKEADRRLTAIYRDRKTVKNSLGMVGGSGYITEPQMMGTRYGVILNKLDARVMKLESAKRAMVDVNNAMRNVLGKPTISPNDVSTGDYKSPLQNEELNFSLNEIIENESINSPDVGATLPPADEQQTQLPSLHDAIAKINERENAKRQARNDASLMMQQKEMQEAMLHSTSAQQSVAPFAELCQPQEMCQEPLDQSRSLEQRAQVFEGSQLLEMSATQPQTEQTPNVFDLRLEQEMDLELIASNQ